MIDLIQIILIIARNCTYKERFRKMESLIHKTDSAYSYPLLIKNLLFQPIAYNPDQEIVYKDVCRITYSTLRERIAKLSGALINLGVKKGDTVAFMDFDSHRYLEAFYAVPMMGAVLHTVNVRLSAEQMIYTINHAEDDVIFINADLIPLLEQIRGKLDTVKKIILLSDTEYKGTSHIQFDGEYEDLLSKAEPVKEYPVFDENTRATTFYTTGTTGLPKGVYFSHRQLVLHSLATLATLATAPHASFNREDIYMPITPMFHVHAWGIPYIATMLGVKQVYPGRYSADILIKLMSEEKVTFSHCVPTILHMLLKDKDAGKVNFKGWKALIGGAALPRALCLEAMSLGIDIVAGYGMSETCPILSLSHLTPEELLLSDEKQAEIRCRTGVPIALAEIKVVDDKGNEVQPDDKSPGEITVRTPWLTQGYLKDTVNSEKLWHGGWLHTNDVACTNPKSSLRIVDRLKDVIKIGGEWVSSLEMEDIVMHHHAVSEAALIGQTDPRWGEIPLALVVLKPNVQVNEKEIYNFVKGYIDKGVLTKEAVLLKVKFIDSIDKTSVGKINKLALREKYSA